ncbi:hypothetical protein KL86DES1_20541 [uncultured Desulfovibrio sp.]|uniref:Uncharacterized protein n=1 Tax=uncultured Desulfovibrio sp. TaxID=167968 RepID=A0A212L4E3_9BACT|nr:hypothetical protein KL86DES1_20541 [uncultured Desulfovibrio sp.]VZH33445.1 conserved protein of unknown function [Desulfovibrio sp. 86]
MNALTLHESAARHNEAWILPSFSRCDEGSYGKRQQLVNRATSLLMLGANRIFGRMTPLKCKTFQR